MHIKKVMAQEFRRFLDLEIVDIPQTAKLVVVAGPNGNGKSSLFDIFLRYKYRHLGYHSWNFRYHSRISDPAFVPPPDRLDVEFHEELPADKQKLFYVRSAYRNEPEFASGQISAPVSTLTDHRVGRLIDNDAAVSSNFQRLYAQGLEDAFENLSDEATIGDLRKSTIG